MKNCSFTSNIFPLKQPFEITINKIVQYVVIGFFALLGLFIVWYFQTIVIYILTAVVLSLIGKPLVIFFSKIKLGKLAMPKWASALLALICIWTIIIGLIVLTVPFVANEAQKLSTVDTEALLKSVEEPINRIINWLKEYNIDLDEDMSLDKFIKDNINEIFFAIKLSKVFESLFTFIGDLVIAAFSISFFTFFFLKDDNLFFKAVITLSPDPYTEKVENILIDTRRLLSRYFIGISAQLAIVATFNTVGMLIVGFDFQTAITIGVASGIFNIIPYVGPILAAAFGLMIGIASNLQLDYYNEIAPLLIKMLIAFSFTQLMDNIIFQPFIFSNSVNAHPLEIFIVILIAGNMGGIIGMMLAIPSYTFIRIIAKQFFNNIKVVRVLTKGI